MNFPSFDRRASPPGLRLHEAAGHAGWRLRAFDWATEGAARGSILFQGGRGDFVEKYLEALGHWHGGGWHLAGFDWRGQGGSQRAEGGGAAEFDAMVEDVAGFAAAWITRSPPPHVLIGHSMGGHLILRLLAERNPTVAVAVLVSPMLGLAHAPLSPRMARMVAGAAVMLGQGRRPLWRGGPDTLLRRQANLTGCADRFADEHWWHGERPGFALGAPDWAWLAAALRSIARLDAPGVLERVGVPVLLIGTERDRLVSAAAIRRAAARLPDAALTMIDGAHELLRETDAPRRAAFAAIDAFLDARAAA